MKRVRIIVKQTIHNQIVNVHTYMTIYRHENEISIRVAKRTIMKRRANNVDYYFTNNRRVIDRVKFARFNNANR